MLVLKGIVFTSWEITLLPTVFIIWLLYGNVVLHFALEYKKSCINGKTCGLRSLGEVLQGLVSVG